ncbi:hypothetical protein C8R47DRAFT_1064378 [Mycena vitilis]|nr:hypothetical protein C8R47DRAFT_1064378 [Mycena vitilis]
MSHSRSHKRNRNAPALLVHGTVASVSSRSNDTRRQRTSLGVVGQDAGPSTGLAEEFWAEDLLANEARMGPNFSYSLGDDSLESQLDDVMDDGTHVDDGINVVITEVPRYANSDRPLKTWYPKEDEYIEEQLRREGRGSPKTYSKCAGVRCNDPNRQCPNRVCTGTAEYRCVDGACFGDTMHCGSCIVAAHAKLPTHFIERWNGRSFERSRTGLKDLGLRMQLGHRPGSICTGRYAARSDFVLYDLSGVHEINVDFCGCEPQVEPHVQLLRACWWPATVIMPNTCATFGLLRLFHVINCLGKLSAYDFLRGLEMCTNHDGLDKPPDRRKPFMHIMRQYREVKRMKRARRGHDAGGARATEQGELALKCRACPQPGWNLPEGWENVDPAFQFIYFIFLAVDANFRLSNRNVSSEIADPILGDGLGYFCKREGVDGYKAHIAKYVNEKEVTSCSGFQALFQSLTRRVKGLRTTGIGGVTCSRHNMWMGNGIGDLQLGERHCNIDFLIVSVIMALQLLYIIISYDIACQYAIHFWDRVTKFPASLQPRIAHDNIWWKVPNFHLPAHKKPCHSPYSFHWMWGAGMTHGEGIEQNWSFSNGAAASTRLMGPGSRHATLEDIFSFHNYDRVLAMHRVLPKRLAVSIKEGTKHRAAFNTFNEGLEALKPEQVATWRMSVTTWEAKQHTKERTDVSESCDSPFDGVEEVSTLREIQLEIAAEEFLCTDDGVEVEREHTPGSFLSMGMELETQQRRLEIDVRALKEPTPTQKLAFTKRRTALLKRIHRFRQVQAVYMPALRASLTDEERQVFDGNGEQLPEVTRLFMPSEITSATVRVGVCAVGLPEVERRLRVAEAEEALEGVRQGLRTRTMTNRFRLRNYTGQGMLTKGQGILRLINIRIHIAKLRYRYARSALLVLQPHGAWEGRLRVLHDDDVRALNERALTAEEKAQNAHWAEIGGAVIEGGVARASGVARGEGSHTLSWIWYTVGVVAGEEDTNPKFYDALRVEWCKAYCRAKRYAEDVRILRAEMRRTIAFGESEVRLWEKLAQEELPGASGPLTEGRRAYAAEHAETERKTCAHLAEKWGPILRRADAYLEGALAGEADDVTVEVDMGDELEAEEEEARLEADEEGEL